MNLQVVLLRNPMTPRKEGSAETLSLISASPATPIRLVFPDTLNMYPWGCLMFPHSLLRTSKFSPLPPTRRRSFLLELWEARHVLKRQRRAIFEKSVWRSHFSFEGSRNSGGGGGGGWFFFTRCGGIMFKKIWPGLAR